MELAERAVLAPHKVFICAYGGSEGEYLVASNLSIMDSERKGGREITERK
jgi:hypothetical protein